MTDTGAVSVIPCEQCRVEVLGERAVRTVFPDGLSHRAAFEDTEAMRELARDLGYGADVYLMQFEREILHTLLAEAEGHGISPTLYHHAGGEFCMREEREEESERVRDLQRLINRLRQATWMYRVQTCPEKS